MSATRAAAHLRTGGAAVPPIPARGRSVHESTVNGTTLVADPAGGLYWTDEKLVGCRIVLVIEATIGPFFSVSARTPSHS